MIRSNRLRRKRIFFYRRVVFVCVVILIGISLFAGVKGLVRLYKSSKPKISATSEGRVGSSKDAQGSNSEELSVFENNSDADKTDEVVEAGKQTSTPNGTIGAQDSSADSTVSTSTKPAVKNSVPVVVLDAGHGGYDGGTIGPSGKLEKNNTLAVSLAAGKILEKKGIKVIYTRTSDKVTWPSIVKQDLLARADISNNANADVFISIHNNSSDYTSIQGTETYYNSASSKGKNLANIIQNQIVKDVKTKDRGCRTEDFSVLRNVKAPSVIVELGYLSNPSEETLLSSQSSQNKFAAAIAQAVLNYLNIK